MGRPPHILRFEGFELDRENRQLRNQGLPVELGSRYFDALVLLAMTPGELVTKDVFMDDVWHGVPVTDEALTQCIRTLRRALGDDAAAPRFIETIPKHGYRFIGKPTRQKEPKPNLLASHVAGACTVAGLTSGVIAGLVYGIIAGTGGGGQVLILAAFIGALGLLAGAGVGSGLAAAITWRARIDGWAIAGSAAGGLLVGALGNLLAREGVGLLSGISITNATGAFEGAVLGTATGVTALLGLTGRSYRTIIVGALISAAIAALLIVLSGGTLLAGSLQALDKGLPGMQLNIDRIGMVIGQPGFTRAAKGLSVALECQVFVLAIRTALLALRNRVNGQH